MLRKNYSHTIPTVRVRQKYTGGPAAAPTAAPVSAGITLTTGSVPQNLRCLTAGQALPGGGTAADGTFVWNPSLATTTLGTLVRYEMRATVSNNDLSGIGQVAIDALNSSTSVLTAAVGAQTASSRVSSAFVSQGQAVVLGADTVSNITNLLPTSASMQAADTAALTASGLTTGSVSSMIAKLSQIDDAEWGTITKNLDGSYSVAEIASAGVTRGQVYQTYDNTGKLVTKTVTGLV